MISARASLRSGAPTRKTGFPFRPALWGSCGCAKNDGTACFYDKNDLGDAAVVIDGNSVTIELVEQALTAAGMQKAEVNLYTPDGAKITTFSFALEVEASVLTDAQIVSSDYYNVLTSDISSALAAAVAADASAKKQLRRRPRQQRARQLQLKAKPQLWPVLRLRTPVSPQPPNSAAAAGHIRGECGLQ